MTRKLVGGGHRADQAQTPLRAALTSNSALRSKVADGLAAVADSDRKFVSTDVRTHFADSLALDSAMESEHAQDHRWDYLLGHAASAALVGVEPHSAKTDQISTVIAKKQAARTQLQPQLRPGKKVRLWIWVASGNVAFAPFDRAMRRLAEAGITFAGREVRAKHLESLGHSP